MKNNADNIKKNNNPSYRISVNKPAIAKEM